MRRQPDSTLDMLPALTHEDMVFLQLCLSGKEDAAARLQAFRDAVVDWKSFMKANGDARKLMPLLHATLQAAGLRDPEMAPYLTTARIREAGRAKRVLHVLGETFEILRSVDIEPIVAKGAAFALRAYAQPELRHCHDLDLQMAIGGSACALQALSAHGYVVSPAKGSRPQSAVHGSGLPILLEEASVDALWRQNVRGFQESLCISSVEDILAQSFARAGGRRPIRLQSACDVALLLRTMENAAIDWSYIKHLCVDRAMQERAHALLGCIGVILDISWLDDARDSFVV